MDALTRKVASAYDHLRRVRVITGDLTLHGDDNEPLATITYGWYPGEVSGEQIGERVTELHVTDRDGVAFLDAVFFAFGGYRYERASFANPPTGAPREWIWRLKPIGKANE
jgi:hypothetical protein